jgi:hypothetical protein
VTDDQFRLMRSIYAAVAAVADSFGSEATAPGLVIPTRRRSLAEASREFLPEHWRAYPLGFDAFVARYARRSCAPAVHAFVELVGHFRPDVAYLAAGAFDPAAHSRGAFVIGLFVDAAAAAGTSFLVVFERVET